MRKYGIMPTRYLQECLDDFQIDGKTLLENALEKEKSYGIDQQLNALFKMGCTLNQGNSPSKNKAQIDVKRFFELVLEKTDPKDFEKVVKVFFDHGYDLITESFNGKSFF